MRKQVIAYLHTHWDREWYREFEVFRLRLLRVFDNILDMLETNQIPCFYFDGQISALEDYLDMRPEKKDLVKSLVYSKKLFIGPFYCLVDEFLTDKTCFEKNLEIGMKYAIDLGCTDFIGYLPDTFGHSENVLDILRDFGIDKCMVWRGCGDFPAEFKWCGMDTVNLVRGYFQDIFSQNCPIEEKAIKLTEHLDLISEKSGIIISSIFFCVISLLSTISSCERLSFFLSLKLTPSSDFKGDKVFIISSILFEDGFLLSTFSSELYTAIFSTLSNAFSTALFIIANIFLWSSNLTSFLFG